MRIKKKILTIAMSLVLLLGMVFMITACDDWRYDLESDKFLGIDEASMRDPKKEFVTLKVGDRFERKKDVLMRKDVFANNPFFNIFTDEGYTLKILGRDINLSYIKQVLEGNLEIQYLRIGGVNYFYDFDDRDDILEAVMRSPNRVPTLASNTMTEEEKNTLRPVVNPTPMGGKERKYFVVESIVKQNWRKETAIVRARVFGSEERIDVVVRMDSVLYLNVVAGINMQDTSDTNLSRVFGGVKDKNNWYLVHQV